MCSDLNTYQDYLIILRTFLKLFLNIAGNKAPNKTQVTYVATKSCFKNKIWVTPHDLCFPFKCWHLSRVLVGGGHVKLYGSTLDMIWGSSGDFLFAVLPASCFSHTVSSWLCSGQWILSVSRDGLCGSSLRAVSWSSWLVDVFPACHS